MEQMIKVGVNGYGTIGRRVADAVMKQPDMKLVGIAKMKADYRARIAHNRGLKIYAADQKVTDTFRSAGIVLAGGLRDLLEGSDVIVDATPDGVGAANKATYQKAGVKAVFQGGEEHSLTNLSFVAQCNFDQAVGKKFVRVVSCNTTGLCRTLHALEEGFGIERARAILARRAADPDEVGKGPIDAVVLDPVTVPSHHGPDVQSVLRGLNIVTMAFKVPTTHMHLHSLIVTLKDQPSRDKVVASMEREPRMMTVDSKTGIRSTAALMDMAREMARPRNDLYEAVVWRDSIAVVGKEVYLFLAVHQEGIVVPENVDAIRALSGDYASARSMKLTDSALGIAQKA